MRDALGGIQTILLLGGSSDIGLAIIERIARDGRLQRVFLAGRSPSKLDAAATAISNRHPQVKAVCVPFDATDHAGHSTIIDDVFAQGPIDCVISAFGQLGTGADLTGDPEAVRLLATVNYVAAITTGTTVVNHLKQQGYGSFVVLSSVAAERPRADNYVYASTKAGLDAWASGLADSLAPTGIDVLVVRPGFVHTSMTAGLTPAPLATTADAVAAVALKGMRNHASLVWAPSSVRPLMSAMRHLPRPVFRFVSNRAGR